MKKSLFPDLRVFLLLFCLSLPLLCGLLLARSLQSEPKALPAVLYEEETEKAPAEKTRKDGFTVFLFLGKDEASGCTDSVILASLDAENGKIAVVQIPRDVYVRTEGTGRKLNSLYPYFLAQTGNASEALAGTKSFLSDALGTRIDYALLLSGKALCSAVDSVGGIRADIPADLDYEDPAQGLSIHLKKGEQLLSGEDTVKFLRFRSSYATADLGRLDAQKILLASAKKAAKTLPTSRLIMAATILYRGCVTDVSLSDTLSLAASAKSVGDAQTVFLTAPGAPVTAEGTACYVLCRDAMRQTANVFLSGQREDVSDAEFDPMRVFTCPEITEIHEIYCRSASSYPVSERSAEEIGEHGIPIPIQ